MRDKIEHSDGERDKATAAKAKITAGMKKALSYAEIKVRDSGAVASLRKKLGRNNIVDGDEQFEVEVETEPPHKTIYSRQPGSYVWESEHVDTVSETFLRSPSVIPKQKATLETPSECFTCEKLIHCDLRSGLTAESAEVGLDVAPCRFAASLTGSNRLNH